MHIEFTIILTPPLVITADGDFDKEAFHGNFPHKFQREMIIVPQNPRDSKRVNKLGRSSDIVTFTFTVPSAKLKNACGDIANEIFQHKHFSPELKILVEGPRGDSVISLSGTNAQQLADQIHAIVKR